MPLINYFEAAASFELAPEQALAFFQAKGLKPTFAWQDMLGDEHDLAFTVARMMDMDLLHTVKGKLDKALADGKTLADFRRELIPALQAAGWWGKADVIDPLTGQVVRAQLGSASRLETIFRTNLQSAYAVGHWQAIEANAADAPWLLYDAVDDHRTRPEHAALDGLVLRHDHPFWDSHAPANGWNCRCGLIQLDDDQLADYGLAPAKAPKVKTRPWTNPRTGATHQVPVDLDPGWDHNPGKTRAAGLKALAAEKAALHRSALAQAKLAEAETRIAQQVAAYQAKLAALKAQQPALDAKIQGQAQKLAQGEVAHHLDSKTAYLATAIKQIQGTQTGAKLTPAQLLAKAQAKALQIEQSAHLSGYKATSIKGKAPSAKQVAAFEALPAEAQASMQADIAARIAANEAAAAAQAKLAEAKDDLADIAKGEAHEYPGLMLTALKAQEAQHGPWDQHPDPEALLAAVTAEGKLQGKANDKLLGIMLGTDEVLKAAVKEIKAAEPNLLKTELLAKATAKAEADKALAAAVAAQLEQQAKAALTEIAEGKAAKQPGLKKKLFEKWSKDGTAAGYSQDTAALVKAIEDTAAVQQAAAEKASTLSGYKKKILAGQVPTAKQKAVFDSLSPAEQAAFLAKIKQAEPAPAASLPHPSDMTDEAIGATVASWASKPDGAALLGLANELAETLPGHPVSATAAQIDAYNALTTWERGVLDAWMVQSAYDPDILAKFTSTYASKIGPPPAGAVAAGLPEPGQPGSLLHALNQADAQSQAAAVAALTAQEPLLASLLTKLKSSSPKAGLTLNEIDAFKKLGDADKKALGDLAQQAGDAAAAKVELLNQAIGFDPAKAAKPAPAPAVDLVALEAQVDGVVQNNTALAIAIGKLTGELPAKPLTPKQAAQYHALTPGEQAVIDQWVTATGDSAAAAKLAALKADQPAPAPDAKTAFLAKLEQDVDAVITTNIHLGMTIAKLKGEFNSPMTPRQVAAYHGLLPAQMALVDRWVMETGDSGTAIKLVELKQPAPAPAPAPPPPAPAAGPPPLAHLTQIGPQEGSNTGGLYQDIKTGTQWYVKELKSEAIAKNEVLTGKLYLAAGIETAETWYGDEGGAPRIFSKIIDGLKKDETALRAGSVASVNDNFVVDAWLANWDVIGMGYDNLKVINGRGVRIDTGAGLLYRAQGLPKGGNFGDTVGEIDSLRDAGTNPQAAAVFRHVTQDDLIAGARKVLAVDRKTIEQLVDAYGPGDTATKKKMIATLLARQADIAKRFPEAAARPAPAPLPPSAAVISPQLHQDLIDARVNGVAVLWDKGDIEDHNVRLTYVRRNKAPATLVNLQLTEAAARRLEQALAGRVASVKATTVEVITTGSLGTDIRELLIGVNARAGKGLPYRDKDIERFNEVSAKLAKLYADLDAHQGDAAVRPQIDALRAYLEPWADLIADARKAAVIGQPAVRIGTSNQLFDASQIPATISKAVTPPKNADWTSETSISYRTGRLDRSHLEVDDSAGQAVKLPGSQSSRLTHHAPDGASIEFYNPSGNGLAMGGKIQIAVPGQGDEAAVRAQQLLHDLGIDTDPPDALTREELWLDQHAYLLTARAVRRPLRADWQKIDDPGPATRIAKKTALLSQWAGHDITQNPFYEQANRERHQAFGHGRRLSYRADFTPADIAQFTAKHRLYHNPCNLSPNGIHGTGTWAKLKAVFNGGGGLSTWADRPRRGLGVGNTPPALDFDRGGANYAFLRIQANAGQGPIHTGVFWRADRLVRRLDAVSYASDEFGEITDTKQRRRAGTLDEFAEHAKHGYNEFNVKDGVSLFEDIEMIVLYNKAEVAEAIADLQAMGYAEWPDGRKLSEVIRYVGQQ